MISSKSRIIFDQDGTLIAVIEISQPSCVVGMCRVSNDTPEEAYARGGSAAGVAPSLERRSRPSRPADFAKSL
jgi:hypothetical protein